MLTLDVTLKSVVGSLNEVVVIGYATQKKKDVTGAVSSVKASEINIAVSSNFQQALQGKAAGVQIIQPTGQPGAAVNVQIRSNPSFANPGVLYIIDGVPVNDAPSAPGNAKYGTSGVSQSPLNFINPNDIETIDFLKDASSRAIYGARASAGVVLITTKSGKSGKPKIQYTGSYGIQNADKMYEVLNTRDYMLQRNLMNKEIWLRNNHVGPYYGDVPESSVATPFEPYYSQAQIDTTPQYPNAMDGILQQGYTQQHDLSISAKAGKTSYYISGNYFDQKGVIIGTGYKRYNGRVNLEQEISDRVKGGINVVISNGITQNTVTGGRTENGGIVTAAMYYPADLPLVAADGSYPLNPTYANIPNPVSFATVQDETKNYRLLAGAHLSWEIIKGLTAKGNFSNDQAGAKRSAYFPTTFLYGANANGIASVVDNQSNSQLFEFTLNYNHVFKERHKVSALAGYSYQVSNFEDVSAGNQQFISDIFSYYNLASGQSDRPDVGSYKSRATWASYFVRGIYQFNDKYSLQASLRRDGYSNFAANKKWGYFPGVSAGWLLSNENFLKNSNVVNYLKLRAGYGEIGNSNFPGSAFAQYGLSVNPYFGQGSPATAIYLTQAANPNLTWETAGEINVGLDFGFLKDRISGSLDYFNKKIRNLIAWTPFPADFTVSGVYTNAGTTKSEGYEIALRSRNIISNKKDGFTWSTNITFSHYLSYWLERSPQALATLNKFIAPSGKDALFNGAYGYVSSGIFNGEFGKTPSAMPGMLPGGLIIQDIHGYDQNGNLTGPNGIITAAETLLGNTDPKFNFGVGNTFTFKNFELNVFFSGMTKKAWSPYNFYNISGLEVNMGSFGWNTMPVSKDRWTYLNPNGSFPTGLSDPSYSGFQKTSSYYFMNASYLRCRNIALSYIVPMSLMQKQKIISGIRLSFDVQNPFTITSYPGLDPELDNGNFFPLTKSYVFGLQISL